MKYSLKPPCDFCGQNEITTLMEHTTKRLADEIAYFVDMMISEAMLCRQKNGWKNLPEIRYNPITNHRVIIIIEEGVEVYRSTIMNGSGYLKE